MSNNITFAAIDSLNNITFDDFAMPDISMESIAVKHSMMDPSSFNNAGSPSISRNVIIWALGPKNLNLKKKCRKIFPGDVDFDWHI